MAKSKAKKDSQRGAQSHLRSRLDYLHKAALYLNTAFMSSSSETTNQNEDKPAAMESDRRESLVTTGGDVSELESVGALKAKRRATITSIPRQYVSHMRGVSLKSQLRLPIEVKRSFCKRCDLLLVPGMNCTYETRNASKGRSKPWAAVLVYRCNACKTEKRFPQTQKRGKKLAERRKELDTKGPDSVA